MIGFSLKGGAQLDESFFLKVGRYELQSYGKTVLGKTARNRYAREPRHVHRDREDVREVHLNRIVDLLADLKRRRWCNRTVYGVTLLERFLKIGCYECSRLRGLQVVRIIIA